MWGDVPTPSSPTLDAHTGTLQEVLRGGTAPVQGDDTHRLLPEAPAGCAQAEASLVRTRPGLSPRTKGWT